MDGKKVCSKCGVEKGLGEYYKKSRTGNDTRELCIICVKEYNKKQSIKRKDVNYIKKRKYFYDENFFEVIDSEEKAYFLGFIFADGCVVHDKDRCSYRLSLKLHTKDMHILESFIKSVKGEMTPWKHGQREIAEVNLSGKKIVNDLIKLGVTPNKTFTIQYPTIDKTLEKHFLRGYFDGDGCIRVNEDKRDNAKRGDLRIVSGSLDMLNKINERMNYLFGVNMNKLYGPKEKEYRYIGWAGMTDIEKIYHGFYDDSLLFLNRKKIIFDEVIGIIKNKQKYRKK
jgi:hypothetical protein